MSGNEPSEAERAGLEVVRGVVDVARHKRLKPSGKRGEKTPDWRVWTNSGLVADIEVTECTDEAALAFSQALSRDGSSECSDERLSCEWDITVYDHSPKKGDRSLPKLMEAIRDVLASVEEESGSLEQMRDAARPRLRLDAEVLLHCGRSRHIGVAIRRRGGSGRGIVRTFLSAPAGGRVDPQRLVSPIQDCINKKKGQLAKAKDRKWLVVMLDSETISLFNEFFGPDSPPPRPRLEGLSLNGVDEVWAFTARTESYAVLRISDGGTRQQHHVVSRSETAVSG